MSINENSGNPDVVLIGAGIMSATLGVLLKQLQPDITIEIFETLDVAAAESSDAWNNAGTGHSAFCELNYTPELPDGSIETYKALKLRNHSKSQSNSGPILSNKISLPYHRLLSGLFLTLVCMGREERGIFEKTV